MRVNSPGTEVAHSRSFSTLGRLLAPSGASPPRDSVGGPRHLILFFVSSHPFLSYQSKLGVPAPRPRYYYQSKLGIAGVLQVKSHRYRTTGTNPVTARYSRRMTFFANVRS